MRHGALNAQLLRGKVGRPAVRGEGGSAACLGDVGVAGEGPTKWRPV